MKSPSQIGEHHEAGGQVMVAYSFKKQFIDPIERGFKRQTIRAYRKRHARPGEPMQIYFGMRTKHCRKIIDDPDCRSVEDIEIHVGPHGFEGIWFDEYELCPREMKALAVADGFTDVGDMHAFWAQEHGTGRFEGVLIKW